MLLIVSLHILGILDEQIAGNGGGWGGIPAPLIFSF